MVKSIALTAVFLTVILHLSYSKNHLLSNVEIELSNMVSYYEKGDTSHAFSIAVKVYFAVQALHKDMQFQTQSTPQLPSDSPVNCHDVLKQIVSISKSHEWQENLQIIMTRIGQMRQKCTNSDFTSQPSLSDSEQNGFDNECAICVVILRVIENYVNYHRVPVADFVGSKLCDMFDGNLKPTCQAFTHFAGPVIIDTLYKKEPSDKACFALGMCKNKNCTIFKQKSALYNIDANSVNLQIPSPWKWLVHLFVDHFASKHFPAFDLDNDSYSDVSTFRGYNWRGSDCNEMNSNAYPGRKTGSKLLDHDCNGIFGLDNRGRLYEDKFCAPYKRYGIAVIGDSAGAHFSIPEKYFNASMIKKGTFDDLLVRLADQLDLPQQSGYTGHTNTSYPSHSIYKHLREWNLCNHNDFQNLGVNGAASGDTLSIIQSLSRRQNDDYPLIMFLELIGNDVCKKSFNDMTRPQIFKQKILKVLQYLDQKVPQGSHLVILGLADGAMIYDYLHADTHPLNTTYQSFYDFLNCLQISPCWGWLNSNQTVRNFTNERAKNLSRVYQQLIRQNTFQNYDIVYYDFPATQILQRNKLSGGNLKQMIERCDGFHPSGEFNSYLADWLWYKIRMEQPEWIGQKNPHNEEIRNIFGLNAFK